MKNPNEPYLIRRMNTRRAIKVFGKRKYAKWHLYNLYALNVVQSDFDNNINTPT